MQRSVAKELLEDIKKLKKGKTDDLVFPLRVLRNNFPKEFKNACRAGYYAEDLNQIHRRKCYARALSFLRKKYSEEFDKVFNDFLNE
jgi:hypothetical protein